MKIDEMTGMREYPLFFSARYPVMTKTGVALVSLAGRAVMEQDKGDGGWWLVGVQPGGIAQTGPTPAEAYQAFRKDFVTVLIDMGMEAQSFEQFRTEAGRFLSQVDHEAALRWEAAREAIRGGAEVTDAFLQNLPRRTEDPPSESRIESTGLVSDVHDQVELELAQAA